MGPLIVALDKFKGSIDAAGACAALAGGLRRTAPDVRCCPVADGGDGTLDALVAAGFTRVPVTATGPIGHPVATGYAARGDVAVVELADASGLLRLPGPPAASTALAAGTTGTRQVLAAALDAGHRTVVLGLGGSASTDGGAGMLAALGARLLDADGRDLPAGGAALAALHRVELSGLHPRLRPGPDRAELLVACDVDNPLLGPHGAAAVYGPQKGAGAAEVALLDAALARWADRLRVATGTRVAEAPGAGAAGGVGFAALAVGGRMRGGIELVLELTGLPALLPGAELVITGEGSLDAQTLRGKAPAGVAAAARRAGVPVVAVAGRILLSPDELAAAGITAAFALTDLEPDPARCMADAAALLERTAHRLALPVPSHAS